MPTKPRVINQATQTIGERKEDLRKKILAEAEQQAEVWTHEELKEQYIHFLRMCVGEMSLGRLELLYRNMVARMRKHIEELTS